MKKLKNLPQEPTKLSEIISASPMQVVSMSLSRRDDVSVSIFAFSANEGVSEEQYPGDTLYYVLEGEMPISFNSKSYMMKQGECIAVEAGVPHAIGGKAEFKMMQIIL